MGGKRAAATNKKRHGEDFYKLMGARGGMAKVPKGFAVTGLGSSAGKIGGSKSKKGSK